MREALRYTEKQFLIRIIKSCYNGAFFHVMSHSEITNNEITMLLGTGLEADTMSNGSFIMTDNIVTQCSTGIQVGGCSNCVIEHNVAIKNTYGFATGYSSSEARAINNNIIAYNTVGVFVGNDYVAYANNTIKHNSIGIQFERGDPRILFYNNCIDSNIDYNLWIRLGDDRYIANNYWGSADSATIRSKIFDYYSDFSRGKVFFTPYLTQPDSSCQMVGAPLGIKEAQRQDLVSVSVYPNPFTSAFTIHTDGSTPINEVSVYNMVGSNIKTIKTKDTKAEIDMNSYPAGMYIYMVRFADNRVHTGKIQKQ